MLTLYSYECVMSEPEQEAVQPIYEVLAALCDVAHSRDTAPPVPFASLPRRVFVALKDAWEAESDAQMMQEYSKLPWLKVHAPTSHTPHADRPSRQELPRAPGSDLQHIGRVAGGVLRAFIENECAVS